MRVLTTEKSDWFGACSISIVLGVAVGVGIGIGVKVAVGSALPHPTSRIAIVTETAQIKVLDIF